MFSVKSLNKLITDKLTIKFLTQEVIAQVQHPKRSMKISQEAQNPLRTVIVASSDTVYYKSRLQKISSQLLI
jgi:chorismate-pyruvate lyase